MTEHKSEASFRILHYPHIPHHPNTQPLQVPPTLSPAHPVQATCPLHTTAAQGQSTLVSALDPERFSQWLFPSALLYLSSPRERWLRCQAGHKAADRGTEDTGTDNGHVDAAGRGEFGPD